MPRVFRLCTPVWQADVDAFGELRTAVLLRFVQEAATRASTDAGFDTRYYERAGSMWLVRRTTLTVLAPVHYGEEIEATTWIADFRRVRSRRDYEVRSGDRLVASARSDWVYVDRIRNQPRTIPREMQHVFAPDGVLAHTREPFPERSPSPTAACFQRRVELHELDSLMHVNNAVYVHYLEQAALDATAVHGWSFDEQVAAGGRFRAIGHDLEYLQAALPGDMLSLLTWPLTVSADRLERYTLVSRPDGQRPLVRATSTYAWADIATGASRPMPNALRAALHTPHTRI